MRAGAWWEFSTVSVGFIVRPRARSGFPSPELRDLGPREGAVQKPAGYLLRLQVDGLSVDVMVGASVPANHASVGQTALNEKTLGSVHAEGSREGRTRQSATRATLRNFKKFISLSCAIITKALFKLTGMSA